MVVEEVEVGRGSGECGAEEVVGRGLSGSIVSRLEVGG